MPCRAALRALILVLMVCGCDLPKDPEGTLDRVQGGVMRVGVSENPSWTMIDGATASGVEVDLVEAFAGELGARIEWVHGTEAELLAALERFALDIRSEKRRVGKEG